MDTRSQTDRKITFGSLFAGIGGLDLGLERAGMECRWQVEIDDYATRVLEKRWPDVTRFRDVRDCGAHNLEPVDLICGGFPCQDVSLAGQRAGLAGERSTLWSEFARIVGDVRPQWVLAENVAGLLSSDDGRFMGAVLRDLAALRYDAEWGCIPAAAVGAPHLRWRVFIVAYAQGSRSGWQGRRHKNAWLGSTSGSEGLVGESPDQTVADANRESLGRFAESRGQRGQWAVEPDVGRVADGVPSRVDRLRCLGNAVVPQLAEWIGRRILDVA